MEKLTHQAAFERIALEINLFIRLQSLQARAVPSIPWQRVYWMELNELIAPPRWGEHDCNSKIGRA